MKDGLYHVKYMGKWTKGYYYLGIWFLGTSLVSRVDEIGEFIHE